MLLVLLLLLLLELLVLLAPLPLPSSRLLLAAGAAAPACPSRAVSASMLARQRLYWSGCPSGSTPVSACAAAAEGTRTPRPARG